MQRKSILVILGLGLVVVAAALAAVLGRGGGEGGNVSPAPPAEPPIEAHPAQPQGLRLLVVFTGAEPAPSEGTTLRAQLVDGRLPAQPSVATVLTDEDCAPDAQGISHCLNRLRLPDRSTLTVRHPHHMSVVPCLTPGERVALQPAAR